MTFFKRIAKTFFNEKFLKFCLFGCVNTLTASVFSSLAHLVVQENLAAIFGYICSLTIAFFINCRFIFKNDPSFHGYLKFLISYIPNFIIYFLVTFLTINTLDLPQFWGTMLAVMAGGPVTFLIIKAYAFDKKDK